MGLLDASGMVITATVGASVTVAAAVAPVPHPEGAGSVLRESDYLLASSETSVDQVLTGDVGGVWSDSTTPSSQDLALVLGPTGIPTPSDQYLQAVYNLYLEPSGLYTGPESDVYALTTPELSGDTETGLAADEADIRAALMPLLNSGHHVTLFGYSQSTAAISEVLNQLTAEYGDKYAGAITFVLVGDSASRYGFLANFYDSLPSWMQSILLSNAQSLGMGGGVMDLGPTQPPAIDLTPDGPYHGDVFTLQSGGSGDPFPDPYASWSPDSFATGSDLWWQELLGMLLGTHEEYLGLTPGDVAQALTQVDPADTVNYLDLNPAQTELEILTQAAAEVGYIPQWLADGLLGMGL